MMRMRYLAPLLAAGGGLGLAIAGGASAQSAPAVSPLPVSEALGMLQFAFRVPIQLSPDGRWVAYTLVDPRRQAALHDPTFFYFSPTGVPTEAAGADVWVTNTVTGERKRLTDGTGASWGPVWSPDGRQLAFYSDRGGATHLWLWDATTGTMRQLSDAIVHPFFGFEVVRWTPDGTQIVAKVLPEGMSIVASARLAAGLTARPEVAARDSASDSAVTVMVYRSPAASMHSRDASAWQRAQARDTTNSANAPDALTGRYRSDLALIDVATGRVRRLVRDIALLGWWISPRGDAIAYTNMRHEVSPTSQNIFYDLAVVSLADGANRVIVPKLEQYYGLSVSWSPDEASLAYTTSGVSSQMAGERPRGDCFIVPASGGTPRNLTPDKHPSFGDDHRAPLWDAEGRFIYLLGADTLWRVSPTRGGLTPVAAVPGHEIREVVAPAVGGRIWSPDGNRSVYVSTRDPVTKKIGVAKIDVAHGHATILFEADQYMSDIIHSVDVAHQTMAYVAEDAQHPPDIWVTDANFAHRHQLTHINPAAGNYVFGTTRIITWQGEDGRVLRGALLLPAGYRTGARYPMIVKIYGGSSLSNSVNRFGLSGPGVENMQILATRGYAVLLADSYLRVGTPMHDLAATVLPGVDRVIALGIADSARLGVTGHSYGGYSTLALLVQTPRFKAAVSSAGFSDLFSMYGGMNRDGGAFGIGWAEEGQGRMGGSPWQYRDRYLENSPFFFLDRVQTPVLLVHGGADDTVHPWLAAQTFVALRRLGKEVEYARYENEEHWQGTWRYANALDYWNRVIAWFDQHLQTSTP
jgi:dipeptidyl aminopeptidase/acylaminoacyl peptidase